MNDADELARRYLTLWTQYLTSLLADPRAMEMLKRWMAFTGQFSYPASDTARASTAPFPAWPPFFGPFGPPVPPVGPDGPKEDKMAALEQRIDALERRLTALEGRPKSRPSRRRDRAGAD